MVQTLDALFDGEVLRPDEPLVIAPNTRVRLLIEVLPEEEKTSASFLDTARSLDLDGPPDWAGNIDAYLYGEESNNGK